MAAWYGVSLAPAVLMAVRVPAKQTAVAMNTRASVAIALAGLPVLASAQPLTMDAMERRQQELEIQVREQGARIEELEREAIIAALRGV